MSAAPEQAIRNNYRAPRFTDTYNELAGDIVARLERHWSLERGERRESMLADIAELQVGLDEGSGLDKTRRRRLRMLVPRAWRVIGTELASRLDAVDGVLDAADPDRNEDGFYWLEQKGRRLSGEWGQVAIEEAQRERDAVVLRLTEAGRSLDQIVQNIDRIRWLATKTRGRVVGRFVMASFSRRLARVHRRAQALIELHQSQTLAES